jgi:hypothetical protein
MKRILDLYRSMQDKVSFQSQFDKVSEGKNILWVSPQLTGKQLYKSILPYDKIYHDQCFTAMTGLAKFNPAQQLVDIEMPLTTKQLLWADYIVIPFTSQPLATQPRPISVYDQIRAVNETIKIVYSIDFNFYEIKAPHPYAHIFESETVKGNIEDNIFHSDITLVSNLRFMEYLEKKMLELKGTKYKDIKLPPPAIGCIPLLIDEETVKGNVTYTPPQKEDTEPVIEMPSPTQVDTAPAVIPKTIRKAKAKAAEKTEEPQPVSEVIKEKEPDKPEIKKPARIMRVGVIATAPYVDDLLFFKKEFKYIMDKMSDKVKLVFFGLNDKKKDANDNYISAPDVLPGEEGKNYECHRPVTIIHYFKKLAELNLDLIFIPLRPSVYNETSENLNKFLEASMFKVPILASEVFPYTELKNGIEAFLLKKKEDLPRQLESILMDEDNLKKIGEEAHKTCVEEFGYTPPNIDIVLGLYN